METVATVALIIVGLAAFSNLRAGTLKGWLGAKFLNAAAPTPPALQFQASSAGSVIAGAVSGLSGGSSAGEQLGTSSAMSPATSGWIAPVAGYTLTQRYGGNHGGHPGVDLAVPTHTPVGASKAGTVTRASWFGGYGNCVDIDHGGGWTSRYGHNQAFTVKVGDTVTQAQQVAWSDSTGDSTGPHCHFEIRYQDQTVDPGPLIGAYAATQPNVTVSGPR